MPITLNERTYLLECIQKVDNSLDNDKLWDWSATVTEKDRKYLLYLFYQKQYKEFQEKLTKLLAI